METHIEGRWCKGRERWPHPQAKERGLEQILPSQPSEGNNPPAAWFWTPSLQNHETTRPDQVHRGFQSAVTVPTPGRTQTWGENPPNCFNFRDRYSATMEDESQTHTQLGLGFHWNQEEPASKLDSRRKREVRKLKSARPLGTETLKQFHLLQFSVSLDRGDQF